ncbi:MAG: 3'-5' exonuclease [Pseudomonadota bacterium]
MAGQKPVDDLLQQALVFESRAAPSLTAFIAWYSASRTEIKRQAPAADAGIRVMTVHGAKGLESPIVMVLDTISERAPTERLLFGEGGTPYLHAAAGERSSTMEAAATAQKARHRAEMDRLMYVAMTRAENWLVIGGAGKAPQNGTTWYEKIAAGIERAGPTTEATLIDGTPYERYSEGLWDRPVAGKTDPGDLTAIPPDWIDVPRIDPPKSDVITPSKLGGAKALPGEDGADNDDALAYGSALHLLLEYLPQIPATDRSRVARRLLAAIDPDIAADVEATALNLLAKPNLEAIFGPDSLAEVDIVAQPAVFGGARLTGSIDRLLIRPDHVLAVDFKSNRIVPDRPEHTPDGILRQLGAYAAALGDLYPHRRVDTAILWTQTADLMPIPHEIVRKALQDTAIS